MAAMQKKLDRPPLDIEFGDDGSVRVNLSSVRVKDVEHGEPIYDIQFDDQGNVRTKKNMEPKASEIVPEKKGFLRRVFGGVARFIRR
jgi:hypothetical protein